MSDRTTISVSKTAAEMLKATADNFGISQAQLIEELALGLSLNRNALSIVKAELGKVSFSDLINDGVEPLVKKADANRYRRAQEESILGGAKAEMRLLIIRAY